MADIFLKIVNMSISACWIVLAIILLRIVLKKSPKWINCVLWGLAGLRLVLPFSFESVFSLIPSAETITKTPDSPRPHIDSGVTIIDNQVNDYLQGNYFEGVTRPMGNFVDISTILAIVWIVGIAALLIYTIISFLRLKGKIGTAVLLRDNIYQSEAVVSPFVLGIIKPKIYLPFNMNGQDMDHVIAHEQAHIHRKDYLWKPLGFLILTLHWFNPMVWFGYILLCRDIELACDEKVIKELNNEQRADYSEALLACSVNRRMIAACPLAFGEVGVKNRIKSVLNYKRPAFWAIVVSVILCVVLAVGFLTNPVNSSVYNGRYETGKCLYNYVVSADKETKNNDLVFDITSDGKVYKTFGDGTTDELGVLKESDYTAEDLEAAMKNQDEKLSIGSIRNAYELSDYIFLQKSNGTVYLVQFFSDGRIMSVFKLNRIDKSDMPNFSGVEKLTWSYNPSLSHTSHYTRTFAFDCEYTHADATCTGGEFWNLEAEGQPRDTNMRFEKGKTVYWTPGEGDGKSADKSEVTLTVYNGESKVQQHTVIFECVSRNYSAGDEYEFYLKDTAEFVLVYSEDGYLTFVERSSIGGVDGPSNVIVSTTIDELKVKYPQFFNVSTDGGLTVYIWQMSANNYSCYLANTSIEAISDNSFAYDVGASISEMRAILTAYDIDRNDITIQPVRNPLSSYYYEIDNAYRAKVKEMFWATIPYADSSQYSPIIDTANFDIDGDEKEEQCVLSAGPTSGLFTFVFSVSENGNLEYFNIFNSPYTELKFEKNAEGVVMLVGKSSEKTCYMGMNISDGNIVISSDEQEISYWGKQGLNSPYAPKAASNLNNAIAKVLNEKYNAVKPDGLIHVENYYLLAHETASGTPIKGNSGHMEIANVYLLVYHMKYSVNGGQLEEVEGDFVPTAITFSIDENDEYTLEEYWTPKTGANYENDVHSKFPGEAADSALNTEKYAEELIKENWRMANEALNRINN